MTFQEYIASFQTILTATTQVDPYTNADYFNYVKLNESRQKRWLKKGTLLPDTIATIQAITQPQSWTIISEPWCGDASHIVPFIGLMAELNSNIQLDIQLRDSAPFLIDNYLTNGGKSIPILIIKNETGSDLAVWGPRPKGCQDLMIENKKKNLTFEDQKIALQGWYNADNGAQIQTEICTLLNQI